MIYKVKNKKSLNLKGKKASEGLSLEKEMEIASATKQPIEKNAIASIFYTQRKDGVLKEIDIRTDRFDIALEAREKANKMFKDKINNRLQEVNKIEEQKIE